MKLQFFTIPAKWPEEAQLAINAFCCQHRVMTVSLAALVPKLWLGNPHPRSSSFENSGSWSFQDRIPKPELGNEG